MKLPAANGKMIPTDLAGGDAVKVSENERVGKEDRIVEEGLCRHQSEPDQRPPAMGAKRELPDLAQRREAPRVQTELRRGLMRHGMPAPSMSILDPIDNVVRLVRAAVGHEPSGDSGTQERITNMPRPSTEPMKKAARQPMSGGRRAGSSSTIEAPAPSAAPSQKLPLMTRSV